MSQLPDDFDTQQPDINPIKQTDIFKDQNIVDGNENTTVQGNGNQAAQGHKNILVSGSNNQIHVFSLNGENLPRQKFAREIPPLLPHLVNRKKQDYELAKGIKKLIEKTPLSPIICIIHGDELQCHDRFLERLHEVSLPKYLGQESIKKYYLLSPPELKDAHDCLDYLRTTLAEIVINRREASLEEINDYFNKFPTPILIHTRLFIKQLQKQEFATLDNLLNFWHAWPFPINQNLIICISIKYEIKRKRHTKKSNIVARLFSYFISYFLKKNRYQKVNQEIHQYIEMLSRSNFDKFHRLSGLVLPELTGVSREDVEEWVYMECTQNVIGEAMADKLLKKIRELFYEWEEQNSSNTIPMDDLAEKLRELLESNLSGEGEIT